jgi:hypothetical protein
MARRWRGSEAQSVPAEARLFVEAHERLAALIREAGLAPADTVVHDLRRAEIRAVWEDEKVVFAVDGIGEGRSASPGAA